MRAALGSVGAPGKKRGGMNLEGYTVARSADDAIKAREDKRAAQHNPAQSVTTKSPAADLQGVDSEDD